MRWLLTTLLCLGLSIPVPANVSFTLYRTDSANPKIHVGRYSGGISVKPEWRFRIDIFHRLAIELAAVLGKQRQSVYILWVPDEGGRDRRFYTLGYSAGTRTSHNPAMEGSRPDEKHAGIVITCYDYEPDIGIVLKLLHAAYLDPDRLKRDQVRFTVRPPYRDKTAPADTIPTLSMSQVWDIALDPDPLVDSLIHLKQYRNGTPAHRPGEIDYYLQDNRYHIYRTGVADIGYSQNPEADRHSIGSDLLVLEHISVIVGDTLTGHFIFTDDSTFYYLNQFQDVPKGPFVIPGLRPGASEIYECTRIGPDRLVLEVRIWESPVSAISVLFDAQKGIVIPEYGTLLDSLIGRHALPEAPPPSPAATALPQRRALSGIPFAVAGLLLLNGIALIATSRKR